jgi:hypothetical protein
MDVYINDNEKIQVSSYTLSDGLIEWIKNHYSIDNFKPITCYTGQQYTFVKKLAWLLISVLDKDSGRHITRRVPVKEYKLTQLRDNFRVDIIGF